MFKRFETKVALRRTRKVSATGPPATAPVPPPLFNHEGEDSERRDTLPREGSKPNSIAWIHELCD